MLFEDSIWPFLCIDPCLDLLKCYLKDELGKSLESKMSENQNGTHTNNHVSQYNQVIAHRLPSLKL